MRQPGYSEIRRRVRRLIFAERMFSANDNVAVGLSGGKDSTFLLHLLRDFQDRFRWSFNLSAYRVVDPGSPCDDRAGLDACRHWCASMNVPLKIVSPPPDKISSGDISPCFRCAWRRKELLFRTLNDDGIHILALGHTAFDLAVTAVMNMMFHGNLETMPPVMDFFNGNIKVIRPLSPVTELQVLRQHRRLHLPEPVSSCSATAGRARDRAETWVREMRSENPHAVRNILKAASRWPGSILKDSVNPDPGAHPESPRTPAVSTPNHPDEPPG